MPNSRAFTFIEMMVAIAILGTLLLLTIPSMRALQNRERLSTAARQIAVLFRYARGEAVFRGKTVAVRFDFLKRTYQLDLAPELDADQRRARQQNRLRSLEEQPRALPADVVFSDVSIWSEQVADEGRFTVEFYPNGTTTPVIVVLADKKGAKMSVELARASGKARIAKGEIENKLLPGQEALRTQKFVVQE